MDSSLPAHFSELAAVDLIGLGLVGVLVILGLWRGLWWQVLRLVGVVAAVIVARVFSPETAAWISEQWPDLEGRLAHGVAWFGIFLLALGAASMLGLLGQRLLEAMQLGLANRLGGGILGAATGLVMHLAGVVILCQLAPAAFVERHVAGTYTERVVDAASTRWRVVLGAEAANEVDRLLKGLHAAEPADEDGPR